MPKKTTLAHFRYRSLNHEKSIISIWCRDVVYRFSPISVINRQKSFDCYRLTTPGYAAASFIFSYLTKGTQCQKGYPLEGAEHLESKVLSRGTSLYSFNTWVPPLHPLPPPPPPSHGMAPVAQVCITLTLEFSLSFPPLPPIPLPWEGSSGTSLYNFNTWVPFPLDGLLVLRSAYFS